MGPVSFFWLQSLDVSTNYLEVAEKSATVKKPRKLNAICEICNKAFRDNWKLKRHMVVHIKAGEISYQEEGLENDVKVDIEEPIVENEG